MLLNDEIAFGVPHECPICFLLRIEYTKEQRGYVTQSEICSFCAVNPDGMTGNRLLRRRVDVMDNTRLDRYPEIMKQFLEQVQLRGED